MKHLKNFLFHFQKEEEEFSVLASCLGLLPTFYQTEHPFVSASCLDWPAPAFDIITQWCFEIKSFTERHAEQGKVCKKHSIHLPQ